MDVCLLWVLCVAQTIYNTHKKQYSKSVYTNKVLYPALSCSHRLERIIIIIIIIIIILFA
jgi:hypothetical protein